MATFGDLQGLVYTQLGGSASLSAATKTSVRAWINKAQQRIVTRRPWWFLEREKEVYSIADEKSGTASTTNLNRAVGGAATSWNAANGVTSGSLVRFGTDDAVYEIDSVASTTRRDLVSTYRGSAAAAATFVAWQQYYDLGSNVRAILNVRDMDTPEDLNFISASEFERTDPGYNNTGTPEAYTLKVKASDGNQQIALYPRPNAVRQIKVRYTTVVADLSSSTSTSLIPPRFHHLLVDGALAEADAFEYEQRQRYDAVFESGIDVMLRDEPTVTDRLWRRYRMWGGSEYDPMAGRLPPNYPRS